MSTDAPDRLSGLLPWTRRCFVCGEANPHGLQQRARVEDGRVIIRYVPRREDLGYRDIVHGGIGMTLLDEVMTWAAIIHRGGPCVAADIHVRLLGPMRAQTTVEVEGHVTRGGTRLILTEGIIRTEDGTALMQAEGKYMPMTDEEALLCREDFVDAPGTIPISDILPE